MTTIAFDGERIAYDSRECDPDEGYLFTDTSNKRICRDGVYFFIAGATQDEEDFIKSYFDRTYKPEIDSSSSEGFIVDRGDVYTADLKDGTFTLNPSSDEIYAVGSGAKYAIAAMDLGLSAGDAVKQAMKRDLYTGGRVRVFSVSR